MIADEIKEDAKCKFRVLWCHEKRSTVVLMVISSLHAIDQISGVSLFEPARCYAMLRPVSQQCW